MNKEQRTLHAAFDEHALKTLLEQNRNQIQRSLEANFGLKPGAVHYYSLKKAAHGLQEAEKKPLPEIIRLLCEIPMREDVVRIIVPHITVYETYFFRHPEHFAWLRDSFLPGLEIRKRAGGKLNITCWSAGCSTGEEAYSLAMTLFDYFKGQQGWELKVVATDINHESLDIARHGCYGEWSFRDLPRETKERFFYECNDALELVPGLPRLKRYHIDTRIQKALNGEYDAIILAAAGVYRLGLQEYVQEELSMEIMLPAPGQGALAIQSRKNDKTLNSILSTIEDKNTRYAVIAERSFLKNLGGGCSAPVAAYAYIKDDLLYMDGLVASVDGKKILRENGSCKNTLDQASQLGMALAGAIMRRGAKKLMQMDKGAS